LYLDARILKMKGTLSQYERFQWIREPLAKEGVAIPLPTGN